MKSEWLPSLNALRAFEAVCRRLNYAHAAEELRVTPAAVKQLVRKLEESPGDDPCEAQGARTFAYTGGALRLPSPLRWLCADRRGRGPDAFARQATAFDRLGRAFIRDGLAGPPAGPLPYDQCGSRRADRLLSEDRRP